jgi:hypothetical protein
VITPTELVEMLHDEGHGPELTDEEIQTAIDTVGASFTIADVRPLL